MNHWAGTGRLCADPEIRFTNSGKTVATYRLAVDRDFKADNQPTADFIPCVVYNKAADFAAKYLKKGMKIGVIGHIQTRDYTNKDGHKVYVTEIIVERQEFCEGKKDKQEAPQENVFGGYPVDDSSDLPF